jgi:hypothetical protein
MIQKELYNDNCLSSFEVILDKIIKLKPNDKLVEIVDSIIIEVISCIRRYFTGQNDENKTHKEFFDKIVRSSLIDHLIYLLGKDNLIISKLLHMLLLSIIEM